MYEIIQALYTLVFGLAAAAIPLLWLSLFVWIGVKIWKGIIRTARN